MLRVVTWNLERKTPSSPTGSQAIERIERERPDIAVVTEARLDSLGVLGGHSIPANPAPGRFAHDERKLIVWSKTPLRDVDRIGHPDMPPGRFVTATTSAAMGDVRVVGVCIPYPMCDVAHGTKDRKPWEQHLSWLQCFVDVAATWSDLPTIVAGDFNQRVPRRPGTNRAAAAALEDAFVGFTIVTSGVPSGCERHGIDHIAVSGALEAHRVWGWPNDDDVQRRHPGMDMAPYEAGAPR